MSNHTPGPWKPIPYGETIAIRSMATDAWNVATVNHGGNYDAGIPNKQNRVDARLIAAAPELLEALEYVVQWHKDNDSGEGELFGLDYVTTCIAAISKAKGE